MKKKKTLEFFFIALTSICDTLFMSFTIQMIKNRKKKKIETKEMLTVLNLTQNTK